MTKPSPERQLEGKISGFSGSGNPIIGESAWDMRIVVVVEDGGNWNIGDKIKFSINCEHSDHYQAAAAGQGKSNISKPDYGGSPNIPIHHDGKHGESVGDTRSERETYQSPEDREPKPHKYYSDKLDKEKPDRTHLKSE